MNERRRNENLAPAARQSRGTWAPRARRPARRRCARPRARAAAARAATRRRRRCTRPRPRRRRRTRRRSAASRRGGAGRRRAAARRAPSRRAATSSRAASRSANLLADLERLSPANAAAARTIALMDEIASEAQARRDLRNHTRARKLGVSGGGGGGTFSWMHSMLSAMRSEQHAPRTTPAGGWWHEQPHMAARYAGSSAAPGGTAMRTRMQATSFPSPFNYHTDERMD